MTAQFPGFAPGKTRLVRLPAAFFTDLLPQIDDADELKITLFCFWALEQRDGRYRYLRRADLAVPESPLADPARREAGLAKALARGTLLAAEVEGASGPETLYFLNTANGRAAVRQIAEGRWRPGDADHPAEVLPERPNIYRLYEENIGPLTPLIADELKDAAQNYPDAWIAEAIRAAVTRNARNWRYVLAVLEGWRKEGKDDGSGLSGAGNGVAGPDSEANRSRYVSGKYADLIES
jgi:DnaD/phage-associated family protein